MMFLEIIKILKQRYIGESFPRSLCFFLFFIFVFNTTALVLLWYRTFFWFDMLMHTLGGVWAGGVALWFFVSASDKEKAFDTKHIFFISLMSVLFVGIIWEIYEIVVDVFVRALSYGFIDGLSDLFFDLLGASFAAAYMILFRPVSSANARV